MALITVESDSLFANPRRNSPLSFAANPASRNIANSAVKYSRDPRSESRKIRAALFIGGIGWVVGRSSCQYLRYRVPTRFNICCASSGMPRLRTSSRSSENFPSTNIFNSVRSSWATSSSEGFSVLVGTNNNVSESIGSPGRLEPPPSITVSPFLSVSFLILSSFSGIYNEMYHGQTSPVSITNYPHPHLVTS